MVMPLLLDIVLGLVVLLCLMLVVVLSRSELVPDTLPGKVAVFRFPEWLYPSTLMRQAGIMPADLIFLYWPLKIVLLCLAPLVLIELHPGIQHWMLIPGAVSSFFTPDFLLWQRRQKRRRRLQGGLSFFVDLMNSYLNSGSSLARAFKQSGRFGFDKHHPLASEVRLVSRELEAGESFHVAFEKMYGRTGVREIERLVAVIELGRKAGASVIETLSRQADVFRERQQELNRKLLSQKSILMLFAMMVAGLPMFAVIVLFPASLKLFEIFELLGHMI